MADIDNTEDQIQVSDITERVDELRADRDGYVIGAPDGSETESPEGWREENPEDAEELDTLEKLLEEIKGYGGDHQWEGDWYPGTLIRSTYFEEAMRDLAEDLYGDKIREAVWPFNCIDWEKAAREADQDYSEVDYSGVEYKYR